MRKMTKLRMTGLSEHLNKVQDIMHKKGAKCREVWPRVRYGSEDEEVHFETVYEVKDNKVDDITRNKKLKNYCTGITTVVE